MIGHHDIGCVESVHLVSQKIGSLVVGVVGEDEAGGHCRVWLAVELHVAVCDEFKGLRCFASRSCTHVEDGVVSLDITEDGWHHAHNLLPGDESGILGVIDQLVDPLQSLILSQQLLRKHHLKDKILWVELFAIHLELGKIYILSPQPVLILMIVLPHEDVIFLFITTILCLFLLVI